MSEELKVNLKVKEQWFCDYCGGIIEAANKGMLEWDTIITDQGIVGRNFRIVHHRAVENCRPANADDNLSDGHLHWYVGPEGLNDLLSIQDRHICDHLEIHDIIRRIHVDHYEEARKYLPLAREEGYTEIDPYDRGDISQDTLKWLVNKYGK